MVNKCYKTKQKSRLKLKKLRLMNLNRTLANPDPAPDIAGLAAVQSQLQGTCETVTPLQLPETSDVALVELQSVSPRFFENVSDMNLDTVELINEIMIRPEIWMSKHPANKNKWKTLRKWEDMKHAKFPLFTVDDLKKRWKNIKDQYRKELKKLPQARPGVPLESITSSWKYFEYMTFLKDELAVYKEVADPENVDMEALGECSGASQEYRIEVPEIKAEHMESPQLSDPKSDDEGEPSLASLPTKPRTYNPPKEMREELLKIEQRKLQILEAEVAKASHFMKSDNYQFLMSLLPEMEKLPAVSKMRLRIKISQAVLDEVSACARDQFNNIELTPITDSTLRSIDVQIKEEPINMYD